MSLAEGGGIIVPPRRNKKDDPLDRIADLFDEAMDGVEEVKKAVRDLASKESVRQLQEEMRAYTEKQNAKQTEAMEKTVGFQVAGARSDIMSEVNSLITGSLDRWASEKLQPLVTSLIEEREKLQDERRAAQIQKYRNWIVLATSGILFLATVYTTLSNKSTDRDYTRSVERLDDLVRP